MPFNFCPQCGTDLQPCFKFCPSCGEKLPCPEEDEAATTSLSDKKSHLSSPSVEVGHASVLTSAPHLSLRKTRKSLATFNINEDDQTDDPLKDSSGCITRSSPKRRKTEAVEKNDSSFAHLKSPARGKPKESPGKPCGDLLMEQTLGRSPIKVRGRAEQPAESIANQTPPKSRVSTKAVTPSKGKGKKGKNASSVEPLCEGVELTDTSGKKWTLLKVLSQHVTEIYYGASCSGSKESDYILKLGGGSTLSILVTSEGRGLLKIYGRSVVGAKDGRLFNEQNFMQRAAKPSSVEKWIKQNKVDFLGIPSCQGFGMHADLYRFLTFSSMGQSLQSIMETNECLPETTVLQLASRIIDVLEYVHSNEYVHGDICAENVFIKGSKVYLAGYGHSFRYAPSGQHVECREGSRTPHEGTLEFMSLDAHKGAAPSRRSDLQSLGFCMLRWHTGPLPWTDITQPAQVAAEKQKCMKDISVLMRHCFQKKKPFYLFQKFLAAVVALQYSEAPDYSELKAGLCTALKQLGASVEQPLSFR